MASLGHLLCHHPGDVIHAMYTSYPAGVLSTTANRGHKELHHFRSAGQLSIANGMRQHGSYMDCC